MATYFIKGYSAKLSIYRRDGGKSEQIYSLSATDSDLSTVRLILKAKIEEYRKEDRLKDGSDTFTDANLNRVLRYYKEELSGRVRTKDTSKRSALNALKRAISAIGSLDLSATSKNQLTAKISSLPNSEHRVVAMNLNQLLKWLNRGFSLELKEPQTPTPVYISEEDFLKTNWPEPKAIFLLAFYSGMRIGEIFGRWELVGPDCILLTKQMLINETTRLPYYGPLKNKKPKRYVYLWTEAFPWVHEIYNWSQEKKEELRVLDWSRVCRKATNNSLTIHDLRHSYAFLSRSRGMGISDLAASLGNSVTVTEGYYAGRGDTPAHILSMRRKG